MLKNSEVYEGIESNFSEVYEKVLLMKDSKADTSRYDCLDEATKRKIEDLSCWHSLDYHVARQSGFFPDQTKAGKPIQRAGASPTQQALHRNAYLRPMVKVHPETGRKSIFCHRDCFKGPPFDVSAFGSGQDLFLGRGLRHHCGFAFFGYLL